VSTAIWKAPVDGRVVLRGVNLAGDDQADRRVHGGPDKAVYAYAVEDLRWWAAGDGGDPARFTPGAFGENLTTAGIDLGGCAIGDRWRVGGAVLEVAQPREPCFKLGIRMGDDEFPGRFERAGRPGAYLRVVHEGDLGAGDEITVEPAAPPVVRLAELTGELGPGVLRRVAADERVPTGWRRAAARELARGG